MLAVLGPFLTGPVAVGPPPVPTPAELARLSLPRTTTWPPTAPARPC